MEYFFVDEERLNELKEKERVIEVRSYNTKCGIWTYFTADDGQIDLQKYDYLVIGTSGILLWDAGVFWEKNS